MDASCPKPIGMQRQAKESEEKLMAWPSFLLEATEPLWWGSRGPLLPLYPPHFSNLSLSGQLILLLTIYRKM